MRIVAGKHKGRVISTPSGRGTRPTSDRAREALFNVLGHAPWAPALAGARALDLFAGSGALGLEALSRGADFCLFVETDSAARGAIRQNIDAMQLFGTTRIHRRSAISLGAMPGNLGGTFDIAFLDPPYGREMVIPALDTLRSGGWLSPDALLIVEMSKDETIGFEDWCVHDERTYGATKMTFLSQ